MSSIPPPAYSSCHFDYPVIEDAPPPYFEDAKCTNSFESREEFLHNVNQLRSSVLNKFVCTHSTLEESPEIVHMYKAGCCLLNISNFPEWVTFKDEECVKLFDSDIVNVMYQYVYNPKIAKEWNSLHYIPQYREYIKILYSINENYLRSFTNAPISSYKAKVEYGTYYFNNEKSCDLYDLHFHPFITKLYVCTNATLFHFKDISCCRRLKDLTISCPVKCADLRPLKHLKRLEVLCIYRQLTHPYTLPHFKYLHTLRITGPFDNLNFINAPNLEKLTISGEIKDISILSNFNKLTELSFCNSTIQDLRFLEKMHIVILELIRVNVGEVPTLKFLKHFPMLNTLCITDINIDSLQGLENCPNITTLIIRNNPLISLEGLENCPNIIKLIITGNKLNSLQGIENCLNITELNIHNNRIKDLNPIENLRQLRYLNIEDNPSIDISQLFPVEYHENINITAVNCLIKDKYTEAIRSKGFFEKKIPEPMYLPYHCYEDTHICNKFPQLKRITLTNRQYNSHYIAVNSMMSNHR